MVTIHCGPEKKVFLAHKDTICATSEYFKAACTKQWVEGQTGVIELADGKPDTFQTYLHWTYTKEFDLTNMFANTRKRCCYGWRDMTALWTLADYLGNRELRNACIDIIYAQMKAQPARGIRASTVVEIFEYTPSGSGVQRLIADHVAFSAGKDKSIEPIEQQIAGLPTYVVGIMAKKYYDALTDKSALWPAGRCSYHDHEEGESKCEE
ncbi:hypothetical protein CLAFUW4_14531 [Fulvia fulva]|uniref:BTB domain-containing protein n=1 Tax=Passalora fulva TaxID=5499 RepID=A0A9Q8PMN5_PASFU|nr:uncharacterized protein CLAFUR5_14362 [Fulvia fulva]UJO25278.1 hypothetical protein CLAFUR5_14362 [Fulvia fulva]WPV22773.1 hypothetical protein CLAFUW4_14531 [Fulvia fulva]